jgi:hypothetical protein
VTDPRRILVQIGLFIDKAATQAEIEAAIFLEDKLAATMQLLGMVRRHELTVDWSAYADEPTFRRSKVRG